MFNGPVGRGIPNAYPLAGVPALSKEQIDHMSVRAKAATAEPCEHCAFRKDVPWRNERAAAAAIQRARELQFGESLICHRSAELKNSEYVPCDHSKMCAGAMQFRLADMLNSRSSNSFVFQSGDEMLAYHAEVAS